LKRQATKSGYILVETLVSVAILSLGLILVLRAFSSQISVLRTAKNYTHAQFLLEEKFSELEQEVPLDVDKWKGETGSFYIETDPEKSELFRNNFTWKVEIDWLKDEIGLLNIVEVKVTVSWVELNVARELVGLTYMPREVS
jgi:type II secretory pathway pseudopilin PulG